MDERIKEIVSNLTVLGSLFDEVRVVDPFRKQTVYFKDGEEEIASGSCYDVWKNGGCCANCISTRAHQEQETFVKVEYDKQRLFMVTAAPVCLDGKSYVFEMLKDVTDSGLVEDIGRKSREDIRLLIDKLNENLVRDELTGLYNRRFINERLPADVFSTRAMEAPLSVIMGDVDFFKKINDTFGHVAGDYVLEQVADLLRKYIPKEKGWAARYGGEEFLGVLPGAGGREAYSVAEQIRRELEKTEFSFEEKRIRLTISFGIYTMGAADKPEDIRFLIERADKRLYEAKERGRNYIMA